MKRLVAIGECMVEMAPTDQAGTFRMGFAGDTMNTAWYLRHILGQGCTVDYLTATGNDTISDQMLAFLEGSGIGTGHVVRRDDLTVGLYMIHLHEGERSFSYWRGQSAARALARDAAPMERALEGAQVAYFSGITLAILPDADRQRLLTVLQAFRAGGGEVVFDPNLRPRLWRDGDTMCAAVMQAAAVSDVVLPSFEDEQGWFADADPAATAQRYAACGARVVVVKNGPDPILTWDGGATTTHTPEPVPAALVIDTTAAGDSFNAGFLAERMSGATTEEAVAAGAQLAAKVVQARGALISLIS